MANFKGSKSGDSIACFTSTIPPSYVRHSAGTPPLPARAPSAQESGDSARHRNPSESQDVSIPSVGRRNSLMETRSWHSAPVEPGGQDGPPNARPWSSIRKEQEFASASKTKRALPQCLSQFWTSVSNPRTPGMQPALEGPSRAILSPIVTSSEPAPYSCAAKRTARWTPAAVGVVPGPARPLLIFAACRLSMYTRTGSNDGSPNCSAMQAHTGSFRAA